MSIIICKLKNIYIRRTKRDDIYAFSVDQILHIFTLLILFVLYPVGQLNALTPLSIYMTEASLAFGIDLVLTTPSNVLHVQ